MVVFIFDTMETFDRWWQSKWKYLYWGRIHIEQQLRDSTQQNYLSLVSLEFEHVKKKQSVVVVFIVIFLKSYAYTEH